MTKTQAQIIELFKTLDQAEQRADLDEGIAQAERGEVRPAEEVFDRLTERFGLLAGQSPSRL